MAMIYSISLSLWANSWYWVL